jgi:hypothetical protein
MLLAAEDYVLVLASLLQSRGLFWAKKLLWRANDDSEIRVTQRL